MPLAIAPVASLDAHQVLVFLLQVTVLLLLALCLGKVAARVGLPAVVGELATGIVLGPSILGRTVPSVSGWLLPQRPDQAHLLDAIGQIAVLLLVGVTGAQLDTRMMRRRKGAVVRIGVGGLVVPLGLGVAAGFVLPGSLLNASTGRPTFALFLGIALCVSAIPVIAKTLSDMKLLHRDVGQLILASASIEDAVGWFLLSLVSTMATVGLQGHRVALSALYLCGFVVAAYFVGRPLVRLSMAAAARTGESGTVAATAVVLILAGAAATQALGLETVFGAFVVGVLLGTSGDGARAMLAPLRTVTLAVLAPIFLASAGLRVDLGALRTPSILLAGAVILVLATVGKFVGGYAGARLSRLTHWEGLAIGAGLNARGVVEIVVASVGLRLGVLTTATYTIVVLVAVVTSLTAPPLLRWAMARVEQRADEQLRAAESADSPVT
jgi:Kef-type K+ transport system membrane component KefB